jgi:hypothetical protein
MLNIQKIILIKITLLCFLFAGCDKIVCLDINGHLQKQDGSPLANEKLAIVSSTHFSYSLAEVLMDANVPQHLKDSCYVMTNSNGSFKFNVGDIYSVGILNSFFPNRDPIEFAILFPNKNIDGYAVTYCWGTIEYKKVNYLNKTIYGKKYKDGTGGLSAKIKNELNLDCTVADIIINAPQ